MDAPIGQWVVAGAVVIGVAAGLLVAGMARVGAQDDGAAVLVNWHLYALIAIGFAGMTITQLSLQTGILPPAVATSSIFNPAASVVLGLTLFDGQVHHSTRGPDRRGDRTARDVRGDRRPRLRAPRVG